MTNTVSVIIPALNEADYLPGLFEALHCQKRPPDEIIVADAGSTDETVVIAQQAGVRVVAGGRPGVGRNAGANIAQGDLLLFLDADVFPEPDFLARLLDEFHRQKLDIAASLIATSSRRRRDHWLCAFENMILRTAQPFFPLAFGCCILINREIHQAIEGFDETVVMSEDIDYVRRAARRGRFKLLTRLRIPISFRRLEKENAVWWVLKCFYGGLQAVAGYSVRAVPFAYEFGHYSSPSRSD